MAGELQGTLILQGEFERHGEKNTKYQLILTSDFLLSENAARKVSSRLNLSDILVAQYFERSSKSPNGDWCLTIHYLKHKVGKVIHEISPQNVTFINTKETCQTWRNRINACLRDKFPHRPKRLLVFINPVSGKKSGPKVYRTRVHPLFTLCGISTDVIETTHSHHTEEILASYDLSKVDGIVSVGGDGTYAEVVSGLLQKSLKEQGQDINKADVTLPKLDTPVGIIPSGTGDGVVGTANTTKDTTTAILLIILGDCKDKDVATVHEGSKFVVYSILLTASGLFADVIRKAETNRSIGRMRYVYGMLYGIFKHRVFEAEVDYLPVKKSPSEAVAGSDGACSTTDGWQHRSGQFIRVDDFLYKISTATQDRSVSLGNGEMGLTFITPCGRLDHARYIKKWLANEHESVEFSFAKEVMVTAYRVRATGQWLEDPNSRYINVDGDIVHLSKPDYTVKNHKGVSKLFSWPHDDTGTERRQERDAEPRKERETEPGKIRETQPGKETRTESGKERETEPGKERETQQGKETRTESGKERETEPGKERETQPGKETGTESEKERETQPGKETGTESEKERETESGKERETQPGKETGTESEKERETQPGKETGTESEKERETESEKERETESGKERETQPGKETGTESEKERETESEKERETESGKERETQPGKETGTESEKERETESGKERETDTGTEPEATASINVSNTPSPHT